VLLIRPFASANGRVARALRALLLGRASGLEPVFVAIDEAMATPPQDSGPDLADESDWLAWELQLQIRQGVTVARRTDELAALWDAIADLATAERLNPRSTTPLFEAALGVVLTNARYMRIAGTETHTATRDFKLLVGRGLLAPLGEKRGRAYRATPRLADLRAATRRPPPPDPT
jgi:Fic family protein